MGRATQTAGSHRSVSALETAAASHIEFVNHRASINIGDPDMEDQFGLTDTQRAQEESAVRIAAINQGEIAFNQPTGPR